MDTYNRLDVLCSVLQLERIREKRLFPAPAACTHQEALRPPHAPFTWTPIVICSLNEPALLCDDLEVQEAAASYSINRRLPDLEASHMLGKAAIVVKQEQPVHDGEYAWYQMPIAADRVNAKEINGAFFLFNGMEIQLFEAIIDGVPRALVVPNLIVCELIKLWDHAAAQKNARRQSSNQLLAAVAVAKLPITVYIEFEGRRNSAFSACYLDVLQNILGEKHSLSAKVWVNVLNILRDTPTNKSPPKKRQRT
jgi:hypothetical protein